MLETSTRWPNILTGDELLALGDIGPAELVAGKIVRRAFKMVQNSACTGNFSNILRQFARLQKSGKVMVGAVGIDTRRNPDSIREPM